MIVKRKGKWCVVSEKSYRTFGTYATKAEAQQREGEVLYRKHTMTPKRRPKARR